MRMGGLEDFGRFFVECGYKDGQGPEAFAVWLGGRTGRTIIAGPVGEPPILVVSLDGPSEGEEK